MNIDALNKIIEDNYEMLKKNIISYFFITKVIIASGTNFYGSFKKRCVGRTELLLSDKNVEDGMTFFIDEVQEALEVLIFSKDINSLGIDALFICIYYEI